MFGLGAQEIFFISLLALLVFGPGRLMEAARELGVFLGRARARLTELGAELASADHPDEWFEGHGPRMEDLFDERTKE